MISIQMFAQDEKNLKAEINKVTVFLQGAQITHEGDISLAKGKHFVKLTELTPYLQTNSISVKIGGGITLINVLHQLNYEQEAMAPKRIKEINDSLELMNDQLSLSLAKQAVLEDEKAMVLANKSIKGQEVLDVVDLQEAAKFFRDHLNELAEKIQEGKIKSRDIQEVVNRLNNEKNTIGHKSGKQTSEIVMEVYASAQTNASFEITYYTSGATWFPSYDIRAKDIASPVVLDYRANIQQSTGVEWKNVELTLSTGNPSISGQAPTLNKWNISYYEPERERKHSHDIMPAYAPSYGDYDGLAKEKEEVIISSQKKVRYDASQPIAISQESTTTLQYIISTPYTIQSNGKSHKVEVAKYEVPASYKYKAVPKIDPTAFLIAQITDWEKLNLLAGEANIFFEDAFVGNSYIDPAASNDTMDISLGRDKGIVITRTKATELSKKQIIGSDRSCEITWQTKIKNNKGKAVVIEIKDQIPVSTNKDIDVTADVKEGILDAETGIIKNEITLNPGEEKTTKFSYKVKHPKRYSVVLE